MVHSEREREKEQRRKRNFRRKRNAVSVDRTRDLQIFSLTLSQLSYPRFGDVWLQKYIYLYGERKHSVYLKQSDGAWLCVCRRRKHIESSLHACEAIHATMQLIGDMHDEPRPRLAATPKASHMPATGEIPIALPCVGPACTFPSWSTTVPPAKDLLTELPPRKIPVSETWLVVL
jgi:hypothetical protein